MGVSEYRGIVSPAYITCKTKPEKIRPRFLHYLLRSQPFIAVYNALSYGVRVGQWDMHYEDFKKIALAYPDKDEQDRIVAFLDQKTAEIDAAIAKKQRLIELLKEQKSILINQAVTKGLNPNAPMKDSGIEWIGHIPAHWEAPKFKVCCEVIKDGLHHTPSKVDEGVNFISTQHVRNRSINIENCSKISLKDYAAGHPRIRPEEDDVLITLVGSIGFAAIVESKHLPLSSTRHVGYVRCRKNLLLSEYLLNYTESGAFSNFIQENVSQTAQPSIYLTNLAEHRLPIPPLEEQYAIVRKLNKDVPNYDKAEKVAFKEIELLQEFKQTLIAHAVTGKR